MASSGLVGSKRNYLSLLLSFGAFVLVFLFETILNTRVKTMQALPSDFESIYWGARLTGYNWNSVVSSGSFSLIQSVFYALLFKLVNRGPLFMWQAFLLIGVFCRSIAAFVTTRISSYYYSLGKLESLLLGIFVSFLIPDRATCLTKQSFVTGIMWLILLILVAYTKVSKLRSRTLLICLTSFVTGLLILSDCALVYVVIVEVFFFGLFLRANGFKDIITFILSSILMGIIVSLIYKLVCGQLNINGMDLLINSYRTSAIKLQYLPSLVLYSLWSVSIYSFGIVPCSLVCILLNHIRKGKKTSKSELINIDRLSLFVVVVFFIKLLINSVELLNSVEFEEIDTLMHSANVFGISGLSLGIGPLFLLLMICKKYTTRFDVSVITINAILLFLMSAFVYINLVVPSSEDGEISSQLLFSSNTSTLLNIFDSDSTIGTVMILMLIAGIITMLTIFILNRSNLREATYILTVLLVFEYLSGYIYIDGALRSNTNYFNQINGTNRFMTLYPDIKENMDELYFAGDYSAMAMLQLALRDKLLILDLPDASVEEYVMFSQYSPDILCYFVNLAGCKYIVTDSEHSDEYIYIKGESWVEIFDKPDILMYDI